MEMANVLKICEIQTESNDITSKVFGGKAAGLALLYNLGCIVPRTIFIEACRNASVIDSPEFREDLLVKLYGWDSNGTYKVAVRSSCTIEDGFIESKAGHYDTFIGEMTLENIIYNIKNVISGINNEKDVSAKMGVIIQEKIDAEYSGVLFSSDPLTFSKKSIRISLTTGIAEGLVSGLVSGEDVVISLQNDEYIVPELKTSVDKESLLALLQKSKSIENELNYPVDIEWAIAKGTLYFLQCRPLASITQIASSSYFVNEENISKLPSTIVSHDKINLRLNAQKQGIMTTDAYISVWNHSSTPNKHDTPLTPHEKSKYCKGYSAVIIYPFLISDKIVRSFVGEKVKIDKTMTGCCRYVVRSHPEHENLADCLAEYANLISSEYWITATIVQEIIDPIYTGAIRKLPDGFLLEIIRGHFFSKGIHDASQYSTDSNGLISKKKEVYQREWLSIIEGNVIICHCNDNDSGRVYLADEDVKLVVDYFEPILTSDKRIAEIGIFQKEPSDVQPYLIDFFDDGANTDSVSAIDVDDGIISRGRVTGKIMHINDEQNIKSLHTHFHSMTVEEEKRDENIVFFCKSPAVSLLSLLERYESDKIGFVFQEGSFLCHLAAVLREKRIPAIKIGRFVAGLYKGVCSIDAETRNISVEDRIVQSDHY